MHDFAFILFSVVFLGACVFLLAFLCFGISRLVRVIREKRIRK